MRHRVVGAVLVCRDAILLCRRRAGRRWYPACWDLPGGHVEDGESPRATLVRECHEELGITVLEVSPVADAWSTATVSMTVLSVRRWAGEPSNRAAEEHDAVRWVRIGELADLRLADPCYVSLLTRAIHRTET